MMAHEHSTCAGHLIPSCSRQKAGQAMLTVNSVIWQLSASSQAPKLDARPPSLKSSLYHSLHSFPIAVAKDNVLAFGENHIQLHQML